MNDWSTALGNQLDFVPHLAALILVYVLALPISWDKERSAGLRLSALVAIAACGFIQAAETVTAANAEATARAVEGLINGVGFTGGGAILVGEASTRGIATAAGLWATGAIGVAVGLGAYDAAIVLSIVTFASLRAMANFKSSSGTATGLAPISRNQLTPRTSALPAPLRI